MNQKITFQGKEYNSIAELPPEAKQAFEKLTKVFDDKDQNGIPDFLEGKANFVDMFKNIYNAKASNVISITNTETNIENSQAPNTSAPQINNLNSFQGKSPTNSSQSSLLFFLGVLLTVLVLGGAFLFFHFKQ